MAVKTKRALTLFSQDAFIYSRAKFELKFNLKETLVKSCKNKLKKTKRTCKKL